MKFCFVGLLWLERKTRLELATPTLARWCSTTELFPHSWQTRTSGLNHVAWFILHCLVFREHPLFQRRTAWISFYILPHSESFVKHLFWRYSQNPDQRLSRKAFCHEALSPAPKCCSPSLAAFRSLTTCIILHAFLPFVNTCQTEFSKLCDWDVIKSYYTVWENVLCHVILRPHFIRGRSTCEESRVDYGQTKTIWNHQGFIRRED